MWPWEHLAFGYVLYSLGVHAFERRAPRGPPVLVLALATQVPDLIDKPLAWVFHLTAVGYSVGHSLLVVVPALTAALALAWRRGRRARRLVAAYAVGHLSHLAGDVIYPALMGKGPQIRRLFWPLAGYEPTGVGAVAHVTAYLRRYVGQVLSGEAGPLFVVQVGLVAVLLVVWLLDGAPGLRTVWNALTRSAGRTSRRS